MELHRILKQTNGGRIEAEISFFFIDMDGREYLAYYDCNFSRLYAAEVVKRARKWKIAPLAPDEAPEIWAHIDLLEAHCLESNRRGKGETYVLQRWEEGPVYARRASGHKLRRFAQGVDWRNLGSWAIAIGCSLVIAACIIILQKGWQAPPAPDPQVTLIQRRAELPEEESYLRDLRTAMDAAVWPTLTEAQKQAVLQQVCQWETTAVLGSSACTIEVADLPEGTLGHYDKANEVIAVSRSALSYCDWQTMLNVVIHESRHAWQRDMIELLYSLEKEDPDIVYVHPFDTYAGFREAWLSYTSGLTDFESYYGQSVEQDSREWSEERLQTYYLPRLLDIKTEITAVP